MLATANSSLLLSTTSLVFDAAAGPSGPGVGADAAPGFAELLRGLRTPAAPPAPSVSISLAAAAGLMAETVSADSPAAEPTQPQAAPGLAGPTTPSPAPAANKVNAAKWSGKILPVSLPQAFGTPVIALSSAGIAAKAEDGSPIDLTLAIKPSRPDLTGPGAPASAVPAAPADPASAAAAEPTPAALALTMKALLAGKAALGQAVLASPASAPVMTSPLQPLPGVVVERTETDLAGPESEPAVAGLANIIAMALPGLTLTPPPAAPGDALPPAAASPSEPKPEGAAALTAQAPADQIAPAPAAIAPGLAAVAAPPADPASLPAAAAALAGYPPAASAPSHLRPLAQAASDTLPSVEPRASEPRIAAVHISAAGRADASPLTPAAATEPTVAAAPKMVRPAEPLRIDATAAIQPAAATPAPGPSPAPSPMHEGLAASAPAPSPSSVDINAALDRLVAAREALMPAETAMSIDHADFGEVTIRIQQSTDGRLSAELGGSDPELKGAVTAAVAAERGASTGTETEGGRSNTGGNPRGSLAGNEAAPGERGQRGAERELNSRRAPGRPEAESGAADPHAGVFA